MSKVLSWVFTAHDQSLSSTARNSANNVDAASKKMQQSLKKTALAFGVLAVAATGASVKMAIDYQAAMKKLVGLVGISAKQVDQWSKQILALATTLPQSPKELADAMYFVTSAGLRGAKAMDVLTTSARAAAAGLGETKTVADAITSAMNAYARQGLKAKDVTDTIVAAVTAGKMPVEDLTSAIGQVLPVASEMGVSFTEVAATAASLSRVGAPVAKTMTGIRFLLTSLEKPAVAAVKVFEKFGYTTDEIRRSIKDRGLLATLQELHKRLPVADFLQIVGGARGITTALGLVGQNSKQVAQVFADVRKSTGATDRAFNSASQTADFKLKVALNGIRSSAISMGSVLLPLVGKVADFFSKTIVPISQNKAAFASLAIGIMAFAATSKVAMQLFANSTRAALTTSVVGIAILGLSIAITELLMHWNTVWGAISSAAKTVGGWFAGPFVNFFKATWTWLKRYWPLLVGILLGPIGIVAGLIYHYWDQISGVFKAGYRAIVGVFNAIKSWVTSNFNRWWAQNGEAIKHIWRALWSAISTVFREVWGDISTAVRIGWAVIQTAFNSGVAVVSTIWNALWPLLHATFSAFWIVIKTTIQVGWVIIRTAFAIGMSFLKAVWGSLWAVLKAIFTIAWKAIQTIWKIGWDIIVGIFTVFINLITGRWGAAWRALRAVFVQVWNAMRSFLSTALSTIWNTIQTALGNIQKFFTSVFNTIKNFIIGNFIHPVVFAFLNFAGWIIHTAASAFGWIPGLGGKLKSAAKAFDTFKNSVNKSLDQLQGKTIPVGIDFKAAAQRIYSAAGKSIGTPTGLYASGGIVRGPGSGQSDSVPAMLSNGEYVVSASAHQHYGTAFFNALNTRRLASGGVAYRTFFPSISSVHEKIAGAVSTMAADWFKSLSAGIGSGVQRWSNVVLQVLSMLGQSASWLGTVLRRMNQESGGNPNAINLWDSNAKHGDPSRGLMQTIGATFAAYAGPFRGLGIYNPLANVYAGLNYALHRYGSLAALNRPGGYDFGGILRPGLTLAYNGTGHNEYVTNPSLARASVVNNYITVQVRGHALASKQEIARTVSDALEEFRRKGGRTLSR